MKCCFRYIDVSLPQETLMNIVLEKLERRRETLKKNMEEKQDTVIFLLIVRIQFVLLST